jgi:hypothetical protein
VKRPPLKRTKGLSPSKDPLKRSRLAPISDGRRAVNAERKRRQLEAWGPRPWTCVLRDRVGRVLVVEHERDDLFGLRDELVDVPPCHGRVNGHEVVSRARRPGKENLLDVDGQVPLCNRHNEWVSGFASVEGLARHSWD